jgi:CubicO group peptidase (beta-lactamase class C family)
MKTLRIFAFIILSFTNAFALAEHLNLEAFTQNNGPGLVVFVIKDGKLIHKQNYGYANRKSRQRISFNTHFRLSSNSKAFTAAAVLLLEQDGKIAESDPIGKFFTDLPDQLKKIQIKHLLHHTSGLPDYGELCTRSETTEKKVTHTDILNWVKANPKLSFEPGTDFEYSNTGYVVLASLVELVSGTPFPDFVKNRIFSPLGMNTSMYFGAKTEKRIPGRALGYGPWPWLKVVDRDSCNYSYGDDGVYTSVEEYAAWLDGIQSGKLFKPEFQKKVFAPSKTNDGKPVGYGYGWGISGKPENPIYFHSGGWVGFRSYVKYFSKKATWIGLLSNYQNIPVQEIMSELEGKYAGVSLQEK